MKTYVDRGNLITFYGSWIPKDPQNSGYRQFLDEQAAGQAELVPYSFTWKEVRSIRDSLLSESDWTMLSDSNPKPNKDAWVSYRNELRNIPQNFTTTDSIIWPTKPV